MNNLHLVLNTVKLQFGEQEGGKLAKRYDTISPSLISTNSSNAARNLTAVAVTAAMNNSNSTTSSLTFIL